ncbi:uncharacterized protein si:ch211-266k8.4 [Tachysurus ichikawai]
MPLRRLRSGPVGRVARRRSVVQSTRVRSLLHRTPRCTAQSATVAGVELQEASHSLSHQSADGFRGSGVTPRSQDLFSISLKLLNKKVVRLDVPAFLLQDEESRYSELDVYHEQMCRCL